jgi:hypothetical protein
VPTTAKVGERRRYREFELNKLANANKFAIKDKTISNN